MSHSLLSRETLFCDFSETGRATSLRNGFIGIMTREKFHFNRLMLTLIFGKPKRYRQVFKSWHRNKGTFWCFFLRFKLYILFWSKLRISTLKLIHVQNLSQIRQKIKDFDLKHGRDDIIKVFYVFERFCARVSSCQAWTSNKWETREGGFFIFCTIFYQNSPAWTGLRMVKSVINQEICATVNLLIQEKFWGH